MCHQIGKRKHLCGHRPLSRTLLGSHLGLCHVPDTIVARTGFQLYMTGIRIHPWNPVNVWEVRLTAIAALACLDCDDFPVVRLSAKINSRIESVACLGIVVTWIAVHERCKVAKVPDCISVIAYVCRGVLQTRLSLALVFATGF